MFVSCNMYMVCTWMLCKNLSMYRLIAHVIVCSGLYSMSCRVPRWVVRFVKNNLQYILDWYIKEGIFPSKLRWKIILTSNIFRPDKRVTLEFLTNVFPNYSVFSSGTVNCNNWSVWSVTKNTSWVSSLVYKAGENYGYDSVTWIHPPLLTLWTTYRSHTGAYIEVLRSEPWETV